jgi:O-6-methylguanine DNA methyltransferase
MKAKPIASLTIRTNVGTFVAHYSGQGLAALQFPSGRAARTGATTTIGSDIRSWHALTTRAVKAIIAGRTPAELPPLDVSSGTEFQQRVWEELLWIPCGETRSYGEVAKNIRKPKAVRAVGGACGANPIPLLIPCHRVLAANHKIGGFSGGLDWKKRLLQIEGARPES